MVVSDTGKERDVDKNSISAYYSSGLRAYQNLDGGLFLQELSAPFQKYETDVPSEFWHALRDYQDEQRKKGEPILIGTKDRMNFLSNDYDTPDMQVQFSYEGVGAPCVYIFGTNNYHAIFAHAKFTNFRWRPGHGPIKTQVPKSRNPPPPPEPKPLQWKQMDPDGHTAKIINDLYGPKHAHDINVASIEKGGSQCP
jgi:hypothetical protein